jgi:hypothetical protein
MHRKSKGLVKIDSSFNAIPCLHAFDSPQNTNQSCGSKKTADLHVQATAVRIPS